MSLEYRVGDVFDQLAKIPDGSIDLIVTSPPFLALRSYLPADHPDKAREIGSESTPADFLDTLLALTAEWGRVLAPHGSLCVELGDTYSGSGGAGGDYNASGMREGQPTWKQTIATGRTTAESTPTTLEMDAAAADGQPTNTPDATANRRGRPDERDGYGGAADRLDMAKPGTRSRLAAGTGWPLPKSRTMIDTLYPACLAYGRNLLTGQPSPAGQWRIRNLIVWARPNPPVGALGDKFRPATSYITVACRGVKRYFDLDAVRGPVSDDPRQLTYNGAAPFHDHANDGNGRQQGPKPTSGGVSNPAGAPPLDWHTDNHPEDGDWLWKMSTQPYSGSHYATFPMALPKRLIEAMCPLRVCTVCGRPSERITETTQLHNGKPRGDAHDLYTRTRGEDQPRGEFGPMPDYVKTGGAPSFSTSTVTLGWSDCGHNQWRTGIVLDPFAGSGTTLDAAQAVGRHAIGIDLDHRNADLARERVGMFLEIVA